MKISELRVWKPPDITKGNFIFHEHGKTVADSGGGIGDHRLRQVRGELTLHELWAYGLEGDDD